MKIVLIRSDRRKESMTRYVTDIVKRGLIIGGAEVVDVDLSKQKIVGCDGCYDCWTVSPGNCKYRDDMDGILAEIRSADMLLLSTPLHHYGMTSQLASFIERTLPLTSQAFIQTDLEVFRNRTEWEGTEKKLGYISVCGFRDLKNFSALQEHFKMIANGMNFTVGAKILRPEGFLLPFHQAHPRTIKAIETALEKAGVEIAQEGGVSVATESEISQPIAHHVENYVQHSTVFWEYVYKNVPEDRGLNQKRASEQVVRDVRVLMSEIITYTDPVATKRLKADFQFVFTDVNLSYHIVVNRGTAELIEERVSKPSLEIVTTQRDWAAMFLGDISPMEALTSGKIKLKGDKSLFTRFEKFFPPPRD